MMIRRPKGMAADKQRKDFTVPPAGVNKDDSEGISN
jgi:hypothetical protein